MVRNIPDIIYRLRMLPIRVKTVAIVGIGRVGSWTALDLARIGVRRFMLIDDDIVSLSNLAVHDMLPYSEFDLDCLKIECLKRRLKEINPNVYVDTIRSKINFDTSMREVQEMLEEANLIVWAVDDPEARQVANQITWWRVSIFPGVYARIGGGSVIICLANGKCPCLRHSMNLVRFADLPRLSASESGITSNDVRIVVKCTVEIVRSMLFDEFLGGPSGFDLDLGNFLDIVKLPDNRYRKFWLKPPINNNCPFCGLEIH